MSLLRVVRFAFLCGFRDYSAVFTWKTWLGGWFLRVLAQVSFFALLGRLLQSEQRTWFLLVGNAVMLAAIEGVYALNMTGWERHYGTLPLLAASPTSPVLVLASRGLYLIADGSVSALGALLVLSPLLGLPVPWARLAAAVPLIVLVGSSAYCFGTFLGGILLGFRTLNSVVANVGMVTLMTLSGVDVPLHSYPALASWVADGLPLTHGLLAIRDTLAGAFRAAIWPAAEEGLVGAGWLVACLATFGAFIWRSRRNGSLDYAS